MKENGFFDIIIIGGGLAGLCNAIHLSKYGKDVLLIEKNNYPKHKVCGEYISNEVLPYLQFLDFNPFDFGAVKIENFQISTTNNKTINAKLPLGGFGIVAGLAIFGHKVMATIGHGITHLTPSRGFAAELAAACTVVIASGAGLPISTTQTLVGAVLGVGMARGIAAINLGVVRNIVVSWVITLPVGAGLSILFFWMMQATFT